MGRGTKRITVKRYFSGRGQWGERITGTTIKDTWTESRGRVEAGEGDGFGWGEVEGWGEKADNCN